MRNPLEKLADWSSQPIGLTRRAFGAALLLLLGLVVMAVSHDGSNTFLQSLLREIVSGDRQVPVQESSVPVNPPPDENAGLTAGQQEIDPEAPEADKPAIETLLYALETMKVELEVFAGSGGAVESLGDDLLVATPRGRLVLVQPHGEAVYLDGTVPMNQGGLEEHAFNDTKDALSFRVTDILLREHTSGHYDLFAAHHYFTDDCIRFRVSATTLQYTEGRVTALPSWRTLFDAEPCIDFQASSDRYWYSLHHAGGKMVMDGPHHILVITGDHGMVGGILPDDHNYDPDAHLGQLIRMEIETGAVEVLTRGHRNSQGLVWDTEGNLWAPDHGPQGGDELNLLVPGNHYGWPFVTYGIGYNSAVPWQIEAEQVGRHDGFVRPVFAWVPSIAPSSIAVNDPKAFPLWKDDLLIASLKNQSIYRVRRHGTAVQYVEQIEIGHRIRDMAHMSDGRLALLLDSYHHVLFLSPSRYYCDEESQRQRLVYAMHCPANDEAVADIPDVQGVIQTEAQNTANPGAQLFNLHCGACHTLHVAVHGVGPHLVDVVGRRAATVGDFRFSSALSTLNHVWTRDSLEEFLVAPEQFAPGTSMTASEATREELRTIVSYILAPAASEQ